jgi:hypothetical protein
VRRRALVAIVVLSLSACSAGDGSSSTTSASVSEAPLPASASPSIVTTAVPPAVVVTSATPTTPASWSEPCGHGQPPGQYDHVIWIWMENKNLSSVLDSTSAPFMTGLAQSCGAALGYVDHGVRPSLPNYIAATSGDTQGIHDDAAPSAHALQADNVFRQVRAVGKTAKSYEEAMPSNCAVQSIARYAVKHNPAAYYVGADDRAACMRDDVAFTQFMPDLEGSLPAFAFITPDLCNDMHDCPVSTGDAWLRTVVPAITSSATYREGRTALFVVFDESSGGGTIPFIAVAPSIVPGTRSSAALDHFSLLAFTEAALGITTRLGQAGSATSLADAFGL